MPFSQSSAAFPRHEITAVILAGGRARRMGGQDKGLSLLCGEPLVTYVLNALSSQVDKIIISANRNLEAYRRFGYPVVHDETPGFQGPLAGIAAAMQCADTPYLLTAPCDVPLLPINLAERLWRVFEAQPYPIVVAQENERLQPLLGLISCNLLPVLLEDLMKDIHKVRKWYNRQGYTVADFSDCSPAFANLNTLNELMMLEQSLIKRRNPA